MSNENTNYIPRRDCLHQLFKIEVLCSRFPSLIPIKKNLKLKTYFNFWEVGGGLVYFDEKYEIETYSM